MDVIKKQEEQINSVTVPNVTGLNLQEAKKVLKEAGLQYELNSNTEENDMANPVILNQLPKQGITVQEGTKMVLYVN